MRGARSLRPRVIRLPFVALLVAVGTAGVAWIPASVDAQVRLRNSESQLLRESAARESRGDFAGAEEVLLQLLEADPTSSGGLFALERVLRAKGEIVSVLAPVDAFLAQDPESPGVRSLKLRVLAEVDSADAVRREADAWIASDRRSEVPYREVSRVYDRLFGGEAGLAVLRDGRRAIGRPDALALEIGDLLAAGGDVEGAASDWALAVDEDSGQVATVTRRVQALSQGSDRAAARLVAELGRAEQLGRRRAGARAALDLRVEGQALQLVRSVAGDLNGRARTTFLSDVARRARDNDMVEVASWAYDELGEDASTPVERRQFDQRIIDVALASGDTLTALDAQRRVAESFSAGSVDRRRATAQVIRLEGSRSDPNELRSMLRDFRRDFPNAPELDDLAATVAGALQRRGDPEGAAAVLEGIEGPKSSLERGYLLLAAGELEQGRAALLIALTGLPPAEATPVIQFAGLLGRLSPAGAEALAAAGVAAHQGRAREGALELADATDGVDEEERVSLLAAAARIAADGREPRVAAEIRTRLVEGYPEAPEAGEASLALARYHARTPDGLPVAIRLLEELITRRPNAAVVPDARVELQRLRSRGR